MNRLPETSSNIEKIKLSDKEVESAGTFLKILKL